MRGQPGDAYPHMLTRETTSEDEVCRGRAKFNARSKRGVGPCAEFTARMAVQDTTPSGNQS